MKPSTSSTLAALALVAISGTVSVQAANTFFAAGDLLLFFQKPGSNNTVYVDLGSAAALYRGAAAGPTGASQNLNIININSTLTAAFGANWATDAGIYVGAVAARSSSTGTQVFNGDQTRTLYVSRSRDSVGTVGQADSLAWDLNQAQSHTAGAGDIIALGNNYNTNTTTQAAVLTVDLSNIDNLNPFLVPGIQGTAFSAFSGGVQQAGSASSFGTFGDAGSLEFALDLYRVVPRNDSETTNEVSGVKLLGSYEGTLGIGTDGTVSFTTIPEPTSVVLSGLAGLALVFRRRRNA